MSNVSLNDRYNASINGMLKEYEVLRQEIITSMQTRNSILTFMFTVVGAIFAAAATSDKDQSLSVALILIFGIPSISIFTLLLWIGEYERMQRAGRYLTILETRFNGMTMDNTLSWENHLKKRKMHMSYPYDSTLIGIILLSLIGVFLGILLLPVKTDSKIYFIMISMFFHIPTYFWSSTRIVKLKNQ